MEKFNDMEFTAEGPTVLSVEPIPNAHEYLNLESEAAKIKVWENGRGFEYDLPTKNLARIQSWEKGGIIRLAIAEAKDGNWPVYREPTLEEMVRFIRVATYAMPNNPLTNILKAQVEARINKQAKSAEERAGTLRKLSSSL